MGPIASRFIKCRKSFYDPGVKVVQVTGLEGPMSICTNMRTMDFHKLMNNVFAKHWAHECLHKLEGHTVETDYKLMIASVKFIVKGS